MYWFELFFTDRDLYLLRKQTKSYELPNNRQFNDLLKLFGQYIGEMIKFKLFTAEFKLTWLKNGLGIVVAIPRSRYL